MRERRIVLVLGSQGSGKTTLAQALVTDARRRGQRVMGQSPNGSMGFGFAGSAAGVERWLRERQERRDADMLVFDDADRYFPKTPKDESVIHTLLLMNRHFYARGVGVDLLFIGRRAQNFSGELHSGVDFLYLFVLSAGDVHGTKRLLEVSPNVQLPTESFRCVRVQPKNPNSPVVTVRVYADGTYAVVDDDE
jgi:energy-coupling factor transporter ATP-binding protein EcfA2